jgi:hypothetical protein
MIDSSRQGTLSIHMSTRGRKPKPRGPRAVLDQPAVTSAIKTALRAAHLYETRAESAFVPSDRSWSHLQDYLRKIIEAANDYNAQTSPNFQRALVATHAQNYVAQVERFFRWLPEARAAGSDARAVRLDAAWQVVLEILFDWQSGLFATVDHSAQKRSGLDWRRFEKVAFNPKRGPTEAAWECVASIIDISGKTLRSEAGATGIPERAFKRPASVLVQRLVALLT